MSSTPSSGRCARSWRRSVTACRPCPSRVIDTSEGSLKAKMAMISVTGALALLAGCASTPAKPDPAASLAGLRLEVPCDGPKFNKDTECHWDKTLLQTADPQWKLKREIVRTFGGKSGTLYDVTLHVRGVVEPKNFTGGEVRHDHFQAGGTPVKNDYNFYSLHVSDPEA